VQGFHDSLVAILGTLGLDGPLEPLAALLPDGGGDTSPVDPALPTVGGTPDPRSATTSASSVTTPDAATIALVTVAAGSGLALLWLIIKAPWSGLFSRLRPEDAGEHPVRAQLLQLIEANPGIHLRELVRRSGKSASPVRHHLDSLQKAGMVTAHAGPGYKCYFLKGKTDYRVMATADVLRAPAARKVLSFAATNPMSAATRIAAEASLSVGAVDYHVRRLSEAGLIEARVQGNRLLIAATPGGQQALAALGLTPSESGPGRDAAAASGPS